MTVKTRTVDPADPAADPGGVPAADTPQLKTQPSVTVKLGVVATALNVVGAYDLHWGDGTASAAAAGTPVQHAYASAGAYKLVVKQAGAIVAQTQVYVRDTLTPTVTHAPAADNPNFIDFTFGDDPAELVSQYRIDFGDDATVQDHYLPKGTVLSHGYPAGDYTVTVTDRHTGRVLRTPVQVKDKEYDPDFTLAQGADTMTAVVTLSKAAVPAKDVWVDWGDGSERATIPAAAQGATASHTYTAADTYIVQVVYADGSTDGAARTVTVPFPAGGGMDGGS